LLGKTISHCRILRSWAAAEWLEGSVQKEGDRVWITAQLSKASDRFDLWSETLTAN
jgi:TolB-like protein